MHRSPADGPTALALLPRAVAVAVLLGALTPFSVAHAQAISFVTAGTFRVGGTPAAVALGRFGHHQHLDAVVTNFTKGTITVLHGSGTGTLADLPDIASADVPLYLAPADYDGDGVLDLVLSEEESDFIYFQRGKDDGTFDLPVTSPSGHDATGVAGFDMNGDGTFDVVQSLAAEEGGRVNILIGDRSGKFDLGSGSGRRLGAPSYSVAVGDFNEDKIPDVAAVSLDNQLNILLGNRTVGLGVPKKFPTGDQPFSVAVADLDKDAHLDVVVVNSGEDTLSVYRGNGTGDFQLIGPFPVGSGPQSLVLTDVDGDGWIDAVTANAVSNDISIASGQSDGTFGRVRNFVAGLRPQAVAVGDLDEDGLPDLVAVNQGLDSPSGSILLAGPRGFGAIESLFGVAHTDAIAVGDLNRDGLPDLALSASTGHALMLFIADPTGGFAPAVTLPTGINIGALQLADVNHDGRLDIVSASADTAEVLTMLAQGDGSFSSPTRVAVAGTPTGLVIADFDRDGNPDAAVPSKSPPAVSVLFGSGDGGFQPRVTVPLTGSPIACAVGDFDDNGIADVAVGNAEGQAVALLLSGGDRSFDASKTVATGPLPFEVAAGDLDGDGHDDLAVIGSDSLVRPLFGNGDGTFTPGPTIIAGDLPFGLAIRDVTGDLQPDLLVANQTSNSVSVIRNAGGRTFDAHVDFAPGLRPTRVAAADFDGDGRYDIGSGGSGAWILTNSTGVPAARSDGNGDARVTAADLTALQRASMQGHRVEDSRRDAAALTTGVDANGDGRLDSFDVPLTVSRIFNKA